MSATGQVSLVLTPCILNLSSIDGYTAERKLVLITAHSWENLISLRVSKVAGMERWQILSSLVQFTDTALQLQTEVFDY